MKNTQLLFGKDRVGITYLLFLLLFYYFYFFAKHLMEEASVGFWYIRHQSSPLVTVLIYRYISYKHNYLVVSFMSLSM